MKEEAEKGIINLKGNKAPEADNITTEAGGDINKDTTVYTLYNNIYTIKRGQLPWNYRYRDNRYRKHADTMLRHHCDRKCSISLKLNFLHS